ncbi:cysteine synthase A [Verrucomicrobia bacterium LW23]|nr:cysteine synthase A [Verrucomicrobia bacterium LW23]
MAPLATQPVYRGVEGHVGNTPLLRLRGLSELTGCEILAKAEFMNPGGSVKDRAALGIILAAEARGELKPGDTIVEGTAGNTGIGLTVIGQSKGYRVVIVIPGNQSPEKMALLRALGAEVIVVEQKPFKDPGNYNKVAQRLAGENGWFWANQFDNVDNRNIHYRTTGPEIWAQTDGTVNAFVSAVGTGGTLAGTSTYLKERNSEIRSVCADPYGAAMWSWFANGNLDTDDGDSYAEGIGQGRVTKNIEGFSVDEAMRIEDQAAFTVIHQLRREEGIFLGLSSGINIVGAARYAKKHGPGKTVVTILCDSGHKYMSRLYNPEWIASSGLKADLPLASVLDV